MAIGNNIKQLRLNLGITQEQLAEQLHISGQAVSKWENQTALPFRWRQHMRCFKSTVLRSTTAMTGR